MKKLVLHFFTITGLLITGCDINNDSYEEQKHQITIQFQDAETKLPLSEVYASLTTRATTQVFMHYQSTSDFNGYCIFTVGNTERAFVIGADKSGYDSYGLGSGQRAISIPSIIYLTKRLP